MLAEASVGAPPQASHTLKLPGIALFEPAAMGFQK
jgi:hypothetical protein